MCVSFTARYTLQHRLSYGVPKVSNDGQPMMASDGTFIDISFEFLVSLHSLSKTHTHIY